MLNIEKLTSEINATAKALHELKQIFREPHQPRKRRDHHWNLIALKKRATILCAIRAHSRGKMHLKNGTVEKQKELIDKHIDQFLSQAA